MGKAYKPTIKEIKIIHLKKVVLMAGVVGFEPTQAVLETDVLPLTLYPYINNILITTLIY